MQQLTRSRTGLLAIILLGAMAIFVVRLFQLMIQQPQFNDLGFHFRHDCTARGDVSRYAECPDDLASGVS